MPQFSTKHRVRHAATEMFDLVADVAAHPAVERRHAARFEQGGTGYCSGDATQDNDGTRYELPRVALDQREGATGDGRPLRLLTHG